MQANICRCACVYNFNIRRILRYRCLYFALEMEFKFMSIFISSCSFCSRPQCGRGGFWRNPNGVPHTRIIRMIPDMSQWAWVSVIHDAHDEIVVHKTPAAAAFTAASNAPCHTITIKTAKSCKAHEPMNIGPS